MIKDINEFHFKTSQECWEGLNEYLCTQEKEITKNGGGIHGPEFLTYGVYAKIDRAWVDPNLDIGKILGYTKKKWSSLVKNYVNFNYLDLIKNDLRKRKLRSNRNYNIAYHFANFHGGGKDCLVSLLFTRRIYNEWPIIIFNVRTSEVTRRLIFDLVLVQRIGEYIFGNTDFELHLYAPSCWITAESFSMYDNHRSIEKLLKPYKDDLGKFQNNILNILRKFKNINPESIKYKVHKRSARQLQKDENGDPISGRESMLVKDLIFTHTSIREFPEDVISEKQRKEYLKKNKGLL